MTGRGYFGMAIYRPKHDTNIGTLWRTSMAYGAAFTATIGCRYTTQASDTPKTRRHIPLHYYHDLADLIDHLPDGCQLVGVELDPRAEPLHRFGHPDRAVYLLGAEDHGLPEHVIARCHRLLTVPTVVPWSLNVAVAGSIVAAHRYMTRDLSAVTG